MLFLIVLVFLLAPAQAAELPDLGEPSRALFSNVQESQLGVLAMIQLRQQAVILDDVELTQYIEDVGHRLVTHLPANGLQFSFFVVDDPTINAFALPGGYIAVHTGLLSAARSESELASVLAHEISHVTQGHISRMIAMQQRQMYPSMVAMLAALVLTRADPEGAQAAMMLGPALMMQQMLNFSRENEQEADRMGLRLLAESDFDPSGMASFFERLQEENRRFGARESFPYLRTHPLTTQRIADMENRLSSYHYRQVEDSTSFLLMRAKVQGRQLANANGLAQLNDNIRKKHYFSELAERYAYVTALMLTNNFGVAEKEYQSIAHYDSAYIAGLGIDIALNANDFKKAEVLARQASLRYPGSDALKMRLAEALFAQKQYKEAKPIVDHLLDQGFKMPRLYAMKGEIEFALGNVFEAHLATAERFFAEGDLQSALIQGRLALKSSAAAPSDRVLAARSRLREMEKIFDALRR
jgi:predicted Zn-dependent protease